MRVRLLEYLALAVIIAMAVLFGYRHIFDGDLFYHIATGREILAQGAIPQSNIHVWATSERPYYPNPAWLFAVIVALLEGSGGLTALVLLKTAVVVALFVVLYRLCRSGGAGPLPAAVLLFLFGMASAFRLTDRPHLFSLLFFSLCLWLLQSRREEENNRIFWLLPPLFVLWANLHSGVVFGLLLLAVILAGELIAVGWQLRSVVVKRLGLLWLLCFAAIFVSPHPLTNLLFLTQLLEPRTFPITEYFSPTLEEHPWFFVSAALLATWALWRRPRPWAWQWFLPAVAFLLLACWSCRFVPFFLMATLPWIVYSFGRGNGAGYWSRLNLVGMPRTIFTALLLLALPVIVALWPPVPVALGVGVEASVAPMGAVRFLQAVQLSGRLYNSQSYGGVGGMYLTPRYRMYQSSYFQVEKDRIEEAYQAAKNPLDWQNFLNRHAIEAVWLDTTREPFNPEYYPADAWALVYYDDFSAVYLRRHGVNNDLVTDHEFQVANPALLAAQTDAQSLNDPFVVETGLNEARRLLHYNPDNRLALAMTAFFLVRKTGEEQAALAVLDDLETRYPEFGYAPFEKGRLLSRLTRYGEGEEAFARYLELVPDDPEGFFELARTHMAAGQPERAREVLLQMIDQFPDQGQGYLLLGTLQLNANDLAAAAASLSRARELLTTNAEVPNLLGIVKAQQGEMLAAIDFFQQALALDPAYEVARLNLQRALRESGGVP